MKKLGTQLTIFRLLMKDSETPLFTKILVAVALGYLITPLDLLPEILSLFGVVDDIVIVPLLIITALKLIPPDLIKKKRDHVTKQKEEKNEIIREK